MTAEERDALFDAQLLAYSIRPRHRLLREEPTNVFCGQLGPVFTYRCPWVAYGVLRDERGGPSGLVETREVGSLLRHRRYDWQGKVKTERWEPGRKARPELN